MKKGWKIAGVAVGLALMLTAVLGTTVFAADPGDEDTTVTCPVYGEGYGLHGANGMGNATMDTVSAVIGLTEEEIQELRMEGYSLAEIAEQNNVSTTDLVAAIMAEKTEELQNRVAEGTLTQEQADLMIQNMEQRTLQAVTRTTIGPPEWSGANGVGGFGACGGGFVNGPTNQVRSHGGAGMMARGSGSGNGICDGTGLTAGSANRWGGTTY